MERGEGGTLGLLEGGAASKGLGEFLEEGVLEPPNN